MNAVLVPIRGSRRLFENNKLRNLAETVDRVLILSTNVRIGEEDLPDNTEVLTAPETGIGWPRWRLMLWALEDPSLDTVFMMDDDVTGDWGSMVPQLQQALDINPFLGTVRAVQSLNLFFYGWKKNYGGVLAPPMGLCSFGSQFYAIRVSAYRETAGFNPNLMLLDDIQLGMEMAQRGYVSAFLPSALYKTDRRPYTKTVQDGGIPPSSRQPEVFADCARILEQNYPVMYRGMTLTRKEGQTTQQRVRFNWPAYARACLARWKKKYPAEMSELFGKWEK